MFSITVYSRPFTVNNKAGDCSLPGPQKQPICVPCGAGTSAHSSAGMGSPCQGAQLNPSTCKPSPEPPIQTPVGLKHGKDRHSLPTLLCPHASFSPGLLLEGPLLSRTSAPSLPTARSKGLCQVPLLSLGGCLAYRCREQVEAGCPSNVFPSKIIIKDILQLQGWAECCEHPQAEQTLLEKLHQAPMAMGVIAMVLGVLWRLAMRKQIFGPKSTLKWRKRFLQG